MGLLAAQLARLSGGLPVVSIDKDARRLEFAAALGIDAALPADDEIKAAPANAVRRTRPGTGR